jgi:hypothetical protein
VHPKWHPQRRWLDFESAAAGDQRAERERRAESREQRGEQLAARELEHRARARARARARELELES